MGTIEKGKPCATVFLDFTKCKGHFGYIVLGIPIVNPIVKKQFKWVTQHLRRNCGRVIITKNYLKLNDIKSYKPSPKYIEKVSCCFHCSYPKEPYNTEPELNIIKARLEELCEEDVKVFNFQGCQPKDFSLHNFPIIPTCTSLYLSNKYDSFDDDLTCQLADIVKVNNTIKRSMLTRAPASSRDIQRLNFRIQTYYDGNKKKVGILHLGMLTCVLKVC